MKPNVAIAVSEAVSLIELEIRKLCSPQFIRSRMRALDLNALIAEVRDGLPAEMAAGAVLAALLNQELLNGPPCDCPHDFDVPLFRSV